VKYNHQSSFVFRDFLFFWQRIYPKHHHIPWITVPMLWIPYAVPELEYDDQSNLEKSIESILQWTNEPNPRMAGFCTNTVYLMKLGRTLAILLQLFNTTIFFRRVPPDHTHRWKLPSNWRRVHLCLIFFQRISETLIVTPTLHVHRRPSHTQYCNVHQWKVSWPITSLEWIILSILPKIKQIQFH
jgi:hypothetical protein